MDDKEALVDRALRHLQASTGDTKTACEIAKATVATDPSVRSELITAVRDGAELVGFSCLGLHRSLSEASEQRVICRLSHDGAIQGGRERALIAVVDIATRTVTSVVSRTGTDAKEIEHSLSPVGDLPFALALPLTEREGVMVRPLTWYRDLTRTTRPAALPYASVKVPRQPLRMETGSHQNSGPEAALRTPDGTALIVSYHSDPHAKAVAAEIKALGAAVIVADSEDFPGSLELTLMLATGGQAAFRLRTCDTVIDSSCLTGVWLRRPGGHVIDDQVTSVIVRDFCRKESSIAFRGWLALLGNLVVNPIHAVVAAENKVAQLAVAAAEGWSVPSTLVTNSGTELLAYANATDRVIFKTFTSTTWCMIDARRLPNTYTDVLSTLAFAPAIFQNEIVTKRDIRVAAIDGDLFSVSVERSSHVPLLDHRLDHQSVLTAHTLPDDVARRLRRTLTRLGLRYAAVDLLLDDRGDYIFLEVNPSGQFLFMDDVFDGGISRRLAWALLTPPCESEASQGGLR
jgi:glutathione synthase/RimK-type ligase-like ATP-grasp enzyme